MFHFNQIHFYTSQGRLICRSAEVVGAPSFLAFNNSIIFGFFSQASVIIKAVKHG